MAETLWYYARHDQQFGPVSATELKSLADSGRLAPDDLLWREGMDAWTTAVNFRGLFAAEIGAKQAVPSVVRDGEISVVGRQEPPPLDGRALHSVLRVTQMVLWGMCVLVVLAGVTMFTRAFLVAEDPRQEAAAAAVFCTFFIAAYVLARCGEKLCRLLGAYVDRRSR
jgi:hypothetical protein